MDHAIRGTARNRPVLVPPPETASSAGVKLLLVAAMFLLPVAGGILLGLLQLVVYTVLARHGRIASDRIPPFLVLFARGMVAVVALAVVFAILTRL